MSMEGYKMTITSLTSKQIDIIKQREKDRLMRLLHVLFGGKKFGFEWTTQQTSFTDGKCIWVKYDVQTPYHREFSEGEKRLLRRWFALHERGHIEYDCLEDYFDWQRSLLSNSTEEILENEKYPLAWLCFFGNVAMDGRMENLVLLRTPANKSCADLANYERRFGVRGEKAGEDALEDFRDCFMHRFLGMTDIPTWHADAINLVDSIQERIEDARMAPSTKECLVKTTLLIKEIWPTLLEWMNHDEKQIHHCPLPQTFHLAEETEKWGTREATTQKAADILTKVNQPLRDEVEPNLSHAIAQEARAFENLLNEINEEEQAFEERNEKVTIPGKQERDDDCIQIMEPSSRNLAKYQRIALRFKGEIGGVSKVLQQLLEGSPDRVRQNQRSGRLQVNRVWKATKCDNANVFKKMEKGSPAKGAVIYTVFDNSGSTNGVIIEQMIKAGVLLTESLQKANIPHRSFAFQEQFHEERKMFINNVYPLKPSERLTNREKSYIGGMKSNGGNRDTVVLQWTVNKLAKQHSEDFKLLIMISDGLPVFSTEESKDTMRAIVRDAAKKGIDVLCLFIGNHDEDTIQTVQYMYPAGAIIVKDNLAQELQKHVKRIIRQRR